MARRCTISEDRNVKRVDLLSFTGFPFTVTTDSKILLHVHEGHIQSLSEELNLMPEEIRRNLLDVLKIDN